MGDRKRCHEGLNLAESFGSVMFRYFVSISLIVSATLACTTVHVAVDETLVVGRTMELGNGHSLLDR